MALLIGFLTFILVLISVFVILLVLVQLPKKETGGGMAFGAGMSEMILGAGSGNVLTRITKYSVIAFLSLSMVLSVLVSGHARKTGLGVTQALEEKARAATRTPAPANPNSPGTPGLQPLATPAAAVVSTTTVVNPSAPTPATPTAPATTPAPAAPATTGKPGGN